MDKEFRDIPLSESNVSLKLCEIQKRCSELLEAPDALLELSLEEPQAAPQAVPGADPYNRG